MSQLKTYMFSSGFRGGRAGSAPPPLGDGQTPSVTMVVFLCENAPNFVDQEQ